MNKETQSILTTMLGGLLISITLSGLFTSYVKPGFKPVLLTAGIILVLVGLLTLMVTIRDEVRAAKAKELHAGKSYAEKSHAEKLHAERFYGGQSPSDEPGAEDSREAYFVAPDSSHSDGHGHDHGRSKAPWLMMVPVLVLLLVAPPALGADSVERATVCSPNNGGDGQTYASRRTDPSPPLPLGTPTELTMSQFINRALYDSSYSVVDNDIQVVGFIVPSKCDDGGYSLVRLAISCCAADAFTLRVHIEGAPPLPANTWVNAVVRAVKDTGNEGNNYLPTATMISYQQIPVPDNPYES